MSETAATTPGAPLRKRAKAEAPKENPDPRSCNYYILRKQRFCRTERRPGSGYCHTHTLEAGAAVDAKTPTDGGKGPKGSGGEDPRVPCPINGNHSVYASRLARHVKVCPDLRFVTTGLPYYTEDLHANRGVPLLCCASSSPNGKRFTHRDLAVGELAALKDKIKQCYERCVEGGMDELESTGAAAAADGAGGAGVGCCPSTGRASLLPDDASSASDSSSQDSHDPQRRSSAEGARLHSRKHSPQHSALLQCLQHTLSQLSKCTNAGGARGAELSGFVELGAGKGGLSVALQELLLRRGAAAKEKTPSDPREDDGEDGERLEREFPFLRWVAQTPKIAVVDMGGFRRKGDARVRRSAIPLHRLRINIKDLDLTKALEQVFPSAAEGRRERWAVLGKHLCGACTDFALSCAARANAADSHVCVPVMVVATCCHHRCELRHMNPPGGGEDGGSGGAVLWSPSSPSLSFTFTEQEFAAMTSMSSWAVCGTVVDAARRTIGYQCKRIIDELRVAFLRRQGYHAVQCRYTTTDVTGEHTCILAWRQCP